MRKVKLVLAWVVYQMPVPGHLAGPYAVCDQEEWDAMERAQPGHYLLIKKGIPSEAEAETLARESPGGTGRPIRLKWRPAAEASRSRGR